jgi:hypothetical protein
MHSVDTERQAAEQQTRTTPLRRGTSSNTFQNQRGRPPDQGKTTRVAGAATVRTTREPQFCASLGLRGDGMSGRSEIVLPDNAARKDQLTADAEDTPKLGSSQPNICISWGKPVDFADWDDLAPRT